MAVISGCAAAAGTGGNAEPPHAVISQVSGELHLTSSRDGQAIFQAQGLAPGRSVTGTVQLSNAGSLVGALSVQQLDVLDQPGVNGGKLSNAVHLDVQDVTGGNAVPVFAGQLAAFGTRALGNIASGAARTYRFTASLPDSGAPPSPTSGDNAYAGSSLSVRYSWMATAPDPGDGGGGGVEPITTLPPKASFYVVSKKLLRRGWLDVMVSCNRACQATAWAQMPKATRMRKVVRTSRKSAMLALPGKRARLRLKLSRRAERQLQAALRSKRRVSVRVNLRVIPVGATKTQAYSKKVVVKRPRRR
jgi:hypothetical protein